MRIRTMPNDLIKVTPGATPQIRLYIQFISDVNPQRGVRYVDGQGNKKYRPASFFYQEILNELTKYFSKCFKYDIKINLRPRHITFNVVGPNITDFRYPALHNPFHPINHTSPPQPEKWQEIDASSSKITDAPELPLVRFYIGDGESLNTDIEGKGNDPIFKDEAAAAARIDYNFKNNFNKVIHGFEDRYGNRTSFFARELRAGYLFTDSGDNVASVFIHELGHVLGLSDRYFEGIDESSLADQVFSFIGWPARRNPPLSTQYVNSIPSPGVTGPDADFDPQNNLMGSRSYVLSARQRSTIEAAEIEANYKRDDVILLLSLNDEAERKPVDIPAIEPNDNEPAACRKTETSYFPSAISVDPNTSLERATFVTANNATGQHNAFFKASAGSLLSVRYRGDPVIFRKLIKGILPLAGFETIRRVYMALGIF
jgi:hypothetical protein